MRNKSDGYEQNPKQEYQTAPYVFWSYFMYRAWEDLFSGQDRTLKLYVNIGT